MLLAEGLNVHNDKCPESLRPFHDNMVTQFNKLVDFVKTEYSIVVSVVTHVSLQ